MANDKFKKMSEVQPAATVGEKDYLVGTLENGQTIKINAKDVALALMKFMPSVSSTKDGLMPKDGFINRGWDKSTPIDDLTISGMYICALNEGIPSNSRYGMLVVFSPAPTHYVIQLWVSNTNQIHVRTKSGGKWTKWSGALNS